MLNTIKKPLKAVRNVWRFFNLKQCSPPVVQIFINDATRKTRYSLTNYPSFLLPDSVGSLWYEVSLYDDEGEKVFSKDIRLPEYASSDVSPENIFSGKLPQKGTFQANIKESKISLLQKYRLRELGKLTSHFYTFFYSPNYASVAMIHPQTTAPVPDSTEKSNFWYSQYLIHIPSIESVEFFQINPCQSAYELNLKLLDTKGNLICESAATVPGFGIRKVVWEKKDLAKFEYAYAASDTLRGNEKPILFSHYPDGSFTALHT